MRQALSLATLLVAACGGSSSSQPATQSGAETTTTSTTTQTQTTSTTTTTGGEADAPLERRRRAQIFPEVLETCTPEGAEISNARPIEARIDDSLGGCSFRTVGTGTTMNTFEFDVFSQTSVVADRLICPAGRSPTFDFQTTTYGTFSSSHRSNDHWELVFAVNDGDRVHVGVRLTRTCGGAAPTEQVDAQGLEIPGENRAVTLYRCAPVRTPCPPVP